MAWFHRLILFLGIVGIFVLKPKINDKKWFLPLSLLIYSSIIHAFWFGLDHYGLPYQYIWIIFASSILSKQTHRLKKINLKKIIKRNWGIVFGGLIFLMVQFFLFLCFTKTTGKFTC